MKGIVSQNNKLENIDPTLTSDLWMHVDALVNARAHTQELDVLVCNTYSDFWDLAHQSKSGYSDPIRLLMAVLFLLTIMFCYVDKFLSEQLLRFFLSQLSGGCAKQWYCLGVFVQAVERGQACGTDHDNWRCFHFYSQPQGWALMLSLGSGWGTLVLQILS